MIWESLALVTWLTRANSYLPTFDQVILSDGEGHHLGIRGKRPCVDSGCCVPDSTILLAVRLPDLNSGLLPPIQSPFRRAGYILSHVRSLIISRSNCANDRSTLSVNGPIEEVVLNDRVTNQCDLVAVSGYPNARTPSKLNFVCPYGFHSAVSSVLDMTKRPPVHFRTSQQLPVWEKSCFFEPKLLKT
jgi:hypothetical protein